MTAGSLVDTGTHDAATGADVDFDIHGFVGVRLLSPTAGDVNAVTRQLGPLRHDLGREPDIAVRFVDDIDDDRALTFAGWRDSASTTDRHYLLRGGAGRPGRTLLPFGDIGRGCEIVCERRVGAVPHLLAVVNLVALTRGVLPLHASAFTYEGAGILATGWAKGGKTETLLAFAAMGASYVGDEWVYLTPDGAMHGVPEPVRLWNWHLRQLPALAGELGRGRRGLTRGLDLGARTLSTLSERMPSIRAASVLRRGAPILARQAFVQLPPALLFGDASVTLHGRLDEVLFLTSHTAPDVTVERTEGKSVAERMRASLDEERTQLLAHHRQFRFAFPLTPTPAVDEAPARERELLHAALDQRRAHHVRHPYPFDINALTRPICEALGLPVRDADHFPMGGIR